MLKPNPFTTAYLKKEIDWYGLDREYSKNGISVSFAAPQGVVPDYLNKNFRVGEVKVPILHINGETWMSLTWMEVQSVYVPIERAEGRVCTAGLGMGYFALKAAAQPEVESIDVYEIDPRVIQFFNDNFKGRRGWKKIRIIEGDARQLIPGKHYDYVFMDVYQTLLPDEVVSDIDLFLGVVPSPQAYRFWGQEAVILDAIVAEEHPRTSMLEREFFKTWAQTPFSPTDPGEGTLDQYYEDHSDRAFRLEVLSRLRIL